MPHPDIAEALGISPPQAQPESGHGAVYLFFDKLP